MVALEVDYATALRILDVSKLPPPQVDALAEAFDALETKARVLGGVDTKEAEEALKEEHEALDRLVVRSLRRTGEEMAKLRDTREASVDRRIERAAAVKPETLGREEQPFQEQPRRRAGRHGGRLSRHWGGCGSG